MSFAEETPQESPRQRFEAEERVFFVARSFLLLGLVALYALGILSARGLMEHQVYFAATLLLMVDSAVLAWLILGPLKVHAERAVMITLVPDLVAFSAMTYLGRASDFFYPVIIVGPIFYALLVSRRASIIAGLAAAFAYAVGVIFIGAQTPAEAMVYGLKAVTVPLVTFIVAFAVDKQRAREDSAELLAIETEELNERLRKRVHELQAVSDITEMVHSSLDFDSVGSEVLDIVAHAIGVTTCCLFVIDKEKSETLFSASRGTAVVMSSPGQVELPGDGADSHLTCVPVFDQAHTMVLFCTTAEEFESLTDDERVVLAAVASELVVAVEKSRLYKLTSQLAITDELTGLANYRRLQQCLDDEIARAIRYDKHLSLLMLDVDDFKAFNDSEGHVAGDGALAEFGGLLTDIVRQVDMVARYGGEEFSVLLPETDAAGAFIAAEKIRSAVESHRFKGAGGARVRELSASIGLATFPTHASDKDSLLREADDALYHAKNGGKNRVRTPQPHGVVTEQASATTDEWTGA